MRHLVLHTVANSPGKQDGAEFIREAKFYKNWHEGYGGEVRLVPVPELAALRRPAAVEQAIKTIFALAGGELFDVFAFFGHGTENWIQTGHTTNKGLKSLATVLGQILTPDAMLWFAACRTAGPGKDGRLGFLQQLVEDLEGHGVQATAWGHTTAGHTTRNPHLALISPDGRTEVTAEQRRILQKKLWEPTGTLRYRMPLFFTVDALMEGANQ